MVLQKKVPSKQKRLKFRVHERIVYPSHGVGQVIAIEEEEIAGFALELYVIHFERERLKLRVPTAKSESLGMRKLSELTVVEEAFRVVCGRARIKRVMWSRRAQEYEAKINSGDLVAISEVVRDLFKSQRHLEQSYSERQIYELALDRMVREIAAVRKVDDNVVSAEIEETLENACRRREKVCEENIPDSPALEDEVENTQAA